MIPIASAPRGVRGRVALASVVLGAYALLHAGTAVWHFEHAMFDAGPWPGLALLGNALGCLLAGVGLVILRPWARCLALGIGVVGLVEIAASAALMPAFHWETPIGFGVLQIALFGSLVAVLLGRAMRETYEERAGSPVRFDTRLARLARAAAVGAVGAIPMLGWMAANAIYSHPSVGRGLAAVAACLLAGALLLLARARAAGIPVLGLGAAFGGASAVVTLLHLDPALRHSCIRGQDAYTFHAVLGAMTLVPGVLLALVVFAAFVPRMVRFARGG
jgi:hypothetical protein